MQKEYIDAEGWSKMLIFFSSRKDVYSGNATKLKAFIEAVYWMLRTGAQWRELPIKYGNWNSVFTRFNEWSKKKIWEALWAFCQQDPDLEYVMIDASVIRANACAAGYGDKNEQGLGYSKGGYSCKVHAVVDALGNVLRLVLTPGQQHDVTVASTMLEGYSDSYVLGDKGYDSAPLREQIIKQGCTPVIPSRSNSLSPAQYDKHIYKERFLVENFFSKLKFYRRVFARFDKKAQNFMSFLALAGAIIWLR